MAVPQPQGRPKLKTAFKRARTIAPLYTSGAVAVTSDGTRLVTCVAEEILLTDVESGEEICRFVGDTQPINSLCITPSSSHLLVFTSSLSLRIYELPTTNNNENTNPKNPNNKRRVPPIRVVSRAHDAPVHICVADPTSTYLASGSADGVVKVWDILRGYVTHVFKGHGGVVSALTFSYPRPAGHGHGADVVVAAAHRTMRLVTASVDTRIRVFNLTDGASTSSGGGGKAEAVLEGHVSVPRGLDVSEDGRWLVSGGRDSVVLVWDLQGKASGSTKKKGKGRLATLSPTLVRTIPILERVEAVGLLASTPEEDEENGTRVGDLRFFTGGEKGVIKVWDGKGEVVQQFGQEYAGTGASEELEEQRQIMNVIYLPSTSTLISVHADQNILFHSLKDGSLSRQLIGYNDEIVDASYLTYDSPSKKRDSHIALATNSSLIRVYSTLNLDARLLEGHSEIVLALDHSSDGRMLVSGSKDKTARVWAPIGSQEDDESTSPWGYGCVGICEGHAESVGAVAMARGGGGSAGVDTKPTFMFTGSQDRTIKMWDLSSLPTHSSFSSAMDVVRCKSLTTHKAHEKDINSLDVSPNDRFLVSGSQDRTAKIYEIIYSSGTSARGELKLLGTCKGHKRGVWCVHFSQHERVLATGSGDKTVKLWSMEDYSCLRTFEGHTNSVLRVDWMRGVGGMQMVSAGSDGLVKVWNVKEEECVATLDGHEDKVWALVMSSDGRTIVSGAADSVVTFWEDCTEEDESEKESKRTEMALKDQDFMNYLSLHDYKRAIQLALVMSQPGRLFSLFKEVSSHEQSTLTGNASVDEVIKTLGGSDLAKLLRYVRDWNTNAKTSGVAQGVLYAVMKLRSAAEVMGAFGEEGAEEAFAEGGDAVATSNTGRTAVKELVEGLIPYSERHLSRLERLVQESYIVDYILGEMDDGMDDDMDVDLS